MFGSEIINWPNGSDCYSGFESQVKYGFSVEVWIFWLLVYDDDSVWYSQAIWGNDGFRTSLKLLLVIRLTRPTISWYSNNNYKFGLSQPNTCNTQKCFGRQPRTNTKKMIVNMTMVLLHPLTIHPNFKFRNYQLDKSQLANKHYCGPKNLNCWFFGRDIEIK
jgi:hypothetical protein